MEQTQGLIVMLKDTVTVNVEERVGSLPACQGIQTGQPFHKPPDYKSASSLNHLNKCLNNSDKIP